jgi:hypothetical protein
MRAEYVGFALVSIRSDAAEVIWYRFTQIRESVLCSIRLTQPIGGAGSALLHVFKNCLAKSTAQVHSSQVAATVQRVSKHQTFIKQIPN